MATSCPGILSNKLTSAGYRPRCDVPWEELPQAGFLGLPDITFVEANQLVFAYATLMVGVWVWRKLRGVASL